MHRFSSYSQKCNTTKGCVCEPGYIHKTDGGPCVPKAECHQCSAANEVYDGCYHNCENSCTEPAQICTLVCLPTTILFYHRLSHITGISLSYVAMWARRLRMCERLRPRTPGRCNFRWKVRAQDPVSSSDSSMLCQRGLRRMLSRLRELVSGSIASLHQGCLLVLHQMPKNTLDICSKH
jgi:hypothetical protein